jgi:predicted RND superfamily exporter protein
MVAMAVVVMVTVILVVLLVVVVIYRDLKHAAWKRFFLITKKTSTKTSNATRCYLSIENIGGTRNIAKT